jgi:hypothetical protein
MILLRSFSPVAAVLLVALAVATAAADTKTSEQCGHEFDQCQARCNTEFKDDTGRRAPCVAKCSGLYAACDAGVAYDKAKPWLEEQAEKTKKFFEELLDKYGKEPQPEPQTKTKKNSI